MPGPAFRTDSQIVRLYGNGGSQAPYVPVLTAPAGQNAGTRAAAAAADRAFAAAARAVPGSCSSRRWSRCSAGSIGGCRPRWRGCSGSKNRRLPPPGPSPLRTASRPSSGSQVQLSGQPPRY
jgi:hypothetical protein